ncbi:hypothetical protein MJO28_006874 [Puccinia striiformis f. sp. tritici]|uniref:Uncharacterized protein n=1 Tax=Puccinia striiformis f. sp. tritici TaxID=168172 RepID=A0ACC0EDT3_9BASI|nr:hypothetical protein MJO28_006874 [Puccinia striiformis f. sp. tritici]
MESSAHDSNPKSPIKADPIPQSTRLIEIFKFIQDNQLTPKKFVLGFLQNTHAALADQRRLWGATGLNSTMVVVKEISNLVQKSDEGRQVWATFIQDEASDNPAIKIASAQSPPQGNYPKGSYQSSNQISAEFCTENAKQRDYERLVASMPFLYQLLYRLMMKSIPDNNTCIRNEVDDDDADVTTSDRLMAEGLSLEDLAYHNTQKSHDRKEHRISSIARLVCGMIAFARNRRCNGLQMRNGIEFLACGITERVNEWLVYYGLATSRRSATRALSTLSSEAQTELKEDFAQPSSCMVSPIICIDNLDIEQRVHTQSIGHRTRTFHGTWGYVHFPSPELLKALDTSELTVECFKEAMKKAHSLQIEPSMFMPTPKSVESYKAVWKSQIARVMHRYVARPDKPDHAIALDPPPVEKISSSRPNIKMLKLMDAPENSAEGIGQVLDATVQQTGVELEEFFGRLQLMDGDLATCRNFNSLRSLRVPSAYAQHSLHNISFQLGASHTMWNIAASIFKAHFGDTNNSLDTGAWRCLENLGIPHTKAFPKKDFTLMINHMEQVHEATIVHLIKTVMNTQGEPMVEQDPSKDLPKIPTAKWNAIIEQVYIQYCTGEAREEAANRKSPKLHNLLIRLDEFSSVIEANRAMKAGDIGRLIFIWKRWSVMSQSLKGLYNYSAYLPRMVLLLTEILPPSLAKHFRHSLLFSPSGRENHFVAKDFYLEIQNYWLKYFFNQTGSGTKIDRLKNLFSLNIHLLHDMMHSLRLDTGAAIFSQSHKNIMTTKSLNVFLQMANNFDIIDQSPVTNNPNIKKVDNSYIVGLQKIKIEIGNDPNLSRFKLHMLCDTGLGDNDDGEMTQPVVESTGYEL